MVTGPQQMPVFSNETITPEEKKNLIAYIESLKVEPNNGGLALAVSDPSPKAIPVDRRAVVTHRGRRLDRSESPLSTLRQSACHHRH